MNPDTKRGVEQVIQILKKAGKIIDGGFCGPRGRVIVSSNLDGPVKTSVKLWMDMDRPTLEGRFYELVFSMSFTPEATETQVVDAMKRLNQFRANAPSFLPEETADINQLLIEEFGDPSAR